MPCALITGATGFIGGHLAVALVAEGWEVHAAVRTDAAIDGVQTHALDGTQARLTEILGDVRPDIVFHLASLFLADHTPEQIEPLLASNIVFPTQLVEAMVRTGCRRLVNTGTAWQYDEEGDLAPVNLYAATKTAFEAILPYYVDAHGLSVLSLRLFDTYGPGDPRRKLIRILIEATQSGAPLDMSPGEQIVDMTHVDDVASAFVTAGQRLMEASGQINEEWFVSGERQTVRELVAIVGQALEHPLTVNFGGRPYRSREVMRLIDPAGRLLPNWQRRRSLAEALRDMA